MTLFADEIRYSEIEKEQSIDHEIEFFSEKELIDNELEKVINNYFELYKFKNLPAILFESPYLNSDPIVGRENIDFNIYIPINGETSSLYLKPSSQYLNCHQYEAIIDEKEKALCMKVNVKNSSEINIDILIEKTIDNRKKNILIQYEYLKKDISLYNEKLRKYISSKFYKLYEKVKLKLELEEKVKESKYLRIIPKDVEPIKIVSKEIETHLLNSVKKEKTIKSLTLAEESYLQIYDTLKELSIYANRLPKSYNKLDEQDIRDQILNSLNLKLKTATATGETFNVNGKTDIIVIDNKKIYFIAECKIWSGKEKFSEAINQLLSYVSKDSFYTTLIVFNKNKSSIEEAATNELIKHVQFVEKKNENRFIFNHPRNLNNKLEISLIIFDL